ncbi:hypothetical protein CJ030_MR5G010205 [Morella rubra]|uniref:RNase H type-1 domain-containing protein n=1 Tax=Morella rubra TaxID=262757 RepID=A0A6A1VJV6_9ROSI|nr:hypothetical protein CJ030_MR5G010205 [Morella rubra]
MARLAFNMAHLFLHLPIVLEGDSQCVINQVNQAETVPLWLITGKVETMRSLLGTHMEWRLQWTPRKGNMLAHIIAKWGLDSSIYGIIPCNNLPPNIISCDTPTSLGLTKI